ncbi:hypothetical protein SELMODRAFT_115920 [Selaginella moellendorffii]|uniref:Pentatricopeptide repeat-containing protein n=2 Tax=Selaginella moellendorffii TaxID=88036 RepID=D8SFG8_SELML|nr:hypothetical protein SELMODRAFT_115920 [Selaginella moellendorffii]
MLSACSHAGKLDRGWSYFALMTGEFKLVPWAEHYYCMVDVLRRVGQLKLAESLVSNMPFVPDSKVWGSLVAVCVPQEQEMERGNQAAKNAFEIEPGNAAPYVLLCNLWGKIT